MLAVALALALAVPAAVVLVRRGGDPRDDVPRAPRFRRLVLDPNLAPVGLLPVLPGVGPVLADRIDAERRRMPFRDVEDLARVNGIGPATLDALRPHLRFGPAGVPPPQ